MKAVRLDTDHELELSVYVGDKKLQEYVMPYRHHDANILECFVAVEPKQRLTVKGKFKGTVLAASFDLMVDGSFLADERILDKGAPLFMNRSLKFDTVYDFPAEKAGWTSKTNVPTDAWESDLYVEDIGNMVQLADIETEDDGRTERPGVGSLSILANVQNSERYETRVDPEWDIHGGGWLARSKQAVRFNEIDPEYAIEVRHHSKKDKIPQKRSRSHRNHWNVEQRFGLEPWARFIFYYRKQSSIDAAGCILQAEEPRILRPYDEDLAAAAAEKAKDPNARPESPHPFPNKLKFTKLGGDFRTQLAKQPE
jgi:hypothetical protein